MAWRTGRDGNGAGVPSSESVRQCLARVSACLAGEAESVHPLVRAHLPAETGTLDVVRDEHATLNHLVTLLTDRLDACDRGEAGACAIAGVVLRDLVDAWRTHVRRLDRVIDPLIRRLEGRSGRP